MDKTNCSIGEFGMNVQPEKFYESCLTYNIIKYFEEVLEKKVYPFSISQLDEKSAGYDYGYKISNKSFFIQYKRPILEVNKNLFFWKINKEQLYTINTHNYNINTYYALPNFGNFTDWYDGLDKTYFIDAPKLQLYLKNNDAKNPTINAEKFKLDTWDTITEKFESFYNNLAKDNLNQTLYFYDILNYIDALNDESKNSTWLYLVEEDDGF